ncbi:MAG: redoxin domain-containing protein [Myxococcales bacterium]|nr:redoxin domain-containing protein [Myxococcales bacterium]
MLVSVALVSGLGLGCAKELPPNSVIVPKTQIAELQRRKVEIERCRTRLGQAGVAHHRTQGLLAEQRKLVAKLQGRLGAGAFAPAHLRKSDGDWQLSLPRVKRLESHDGKPQRVQMSHLLKGHRAVVIAYWATWCKPCTSTEELAHLAELQRQLALYDARVLSFAVDGLDAVMSDPRAATWRYPLVQKDNGHLDTLPKALVQSTGLGLPLFVVVDDSGKAQWLRKGKLDDEVIEELVTAAARVGRR